MTRALGALVCAAVVAVLAGCGDAPAPDPAITTSATTAPVTGTAESRSLAELFVVRLEEQGSAWLDNCNNGELVMTSNCESIIADSGRLASEVARAARGRGDAYQGVSEAADTLYAAIVEWRDECPKTAPNSRERWACADTLVQVNLGPINIRAAIHEAES